MEVRSICSYAMLMTLIVGCSDSGNYVLYSSLNRLPETPKQETDWTPQRNLVQPPVTEPAKPSKDPSPPESEDDGVAAASETEPEEPAENPSEPAESEDSSNDSQSTESSKSNSTAEAEETTANETREIKLLIPEKRFRREGDDDLLRVSYDDIDLLKVLNMEPVPHNAVDYFPDWLNNLDGQRIRIRGFMFPHFLATGIKRFALARDNGICCFVKEPKIYDVFEVSLAENEVTDYIEGKPFDVEGTFRIDPDADDTELFQLYRIENAKVIR